MQLVNLVLPLAAVIALGYVLRKTGFLAPIFPEQLNRFTYFITLPVLLFTKAVRIEFTDLSYASAAIGYLLIVLLTVVLAVALSPLVSGMGRGAFVQVAFRGNLAYLGLPIAAAAYGDDALPIIAVIVAVGVLAHTLLSIAVLRLLAAHREERRLTDRLLDIAKNPLVISTVIGLLVAASKVPIPAALSATLELVADMSLPSILLVVGFSLSFTNIWSNFRAAGLATLIKLVMMPAIAFLVMRLLFAAEGELLATVVVMAGMPSAIVSQSFAQAFEADQELTAGTVSFATLFAMITVPVLIAIAG